jgi:hypothetical protein
VSGPDAGDEGGRETNVYLKAVWSYRPERAANVLVLTRKELDHRRRIYQIYGIKPETLEMVSADFILQREALARFAIRELDVLLKVGGVFEITIVDSKSHSLYSRSRDQVKYEFAISTHGRYQLVGTRTALDGKVLTLIYRKICAVLPDGDAIDRWTFGIITNGKKPALVAALVESIVRQGIPSYEILICGLHDAALHPDALIRNIEDVVLEDDVRAPIAAKKNRIIRGASYNNLCILHDRFFLPDDWYVNFRRYGNQFDILCLPTLDRSGRRFSVDWMTFCYPLGKTSTRNAPLRYSRWAPDVIVQGGVIVCKRHLVSEYGLNETLHWEELEDMHFSKTAYLNGALVGIDVNNFFYSESVNHRASGRQGMVHRIVGWMTWYRGLLTSFVKFRLYTARYYRDRAFGRKQAGPAARAGKRGSRDC